MSALRGRARRAVEAAIKPQRRPRRPSAQRELDDKMAQIAQAHAETTGRMREMGEQLAQRQSGWRGCWQSGSTRSARRSASGLAEQTRTTGDNLGRLHERLAVIDAAQSRLSGLTEQVIGLKEILANKQARGAFGQGRMEAIVKDGLPARFYAFQHPLSNATRPDCVVFPPGDPRKLVIDAKFPLEAFLAARQAKDEEARRAAQARVRADFIRHVKDIADKYIIPGETQEVALLFVPSESVFADLHEHFPDVVERAHKARVMVVSPSLLMMAVQVMLGVVRDARIREEAQTLQREVGAMMEEVRRLAERVRRLDGHFRQAQEDVADALVSAEKTLRRGRRIAALDLPAASAAGDGAVPAVVARGVLSAAFDRGARRCDMIVCVRTILRPLPRDEASRHRHRARRDLRMRPRGG
ncbi:MAG: DNA recombination protein RmuC [Rhodoblastus sp.]|nr:MAG: DNA recombination protein RmuC [Rhodoblastus sp.]